MRERKSGGDAESFVFPAAVPVLEKLASRLFDHVRDLGCFSHASQQLQTLCPPLFLSKLGCSFLGRNEWGNCEAIVHSPCGDLMWCRVFSDSPCRKLPKRMLFWSTRPRQAFRLFKFLGHEEGKQYLYTWRCIHLRCTNNLCTNKDEGDEKLFVHLRCRSGVTPWV